ncbi:hypothetical protein D3C86_990270 [compost metagenome]
MPFRSRGIFIADPARRLVGKWTGAADDARQQHHASGNHAAERRVYRFVFRCPELLREHFIFPAAHEAGGGNGTAESIDIQERVTGGIERTRRAANGEIHHPGAGGDDRKITVPAQKMRQERRVGIVDATIDRHMRRKAGFHCQRWADCSQHIKSGANRRHQLLDAETRDERGEILPPRVPEIRMAAERSRFRGLNAGQPPRPILRIGDNTLHSGEIVRKGLFLEMDLRAKVQPGGKLR